MQSSFTAMETFVNVLIYEARNLKNTQIIGRQSPYATVSTTSAPGRHLQRTATYVSGGIHQPNVRV